MADEEGGPTTARERRAQRVRQQTRRQLPLKTLKTASIWIAVALALAGIVWGAQFLKGPEFTHIHVAFKMYAGDEEIQFTSPAYDLQQTGYGRAHLHTNDRATHVLHIEGTPGVGVRMEQFFLALKVEVRNDYVKLDPLQPHNSREWANNATHSWQLWLNKCTSPPTDWEKIGSWPGFQPHQHDRMLIMYTRSNATVDDLMPKFNAVPSEEEINQTARDNCDDRKP